MKKSIIILILVVFLGSVFVVGVFGLENVPYNERIYVKEIIPTEVTLSTNEKVEIMKEIDKEGKQVYYIRCVYEEGMRVFVNYNITPDNASNRKVNVTVENVNENSDAELMANGSIKLNDRGIVKITFRAVDSGDPPKMVFYIHTKKAPTAAQ